MTSPTLTGPVRPVAPALPAAFGNLRRTLTTAEAATYIGIAASTLEKRRVYGGGPAFIKLGLSVRHRVEDLDALLGEHGYRSTSEYTLH